MVTRSISSRRLLDRDELIHMRWLKALAVLVVAVWLCLDALDGLHFCSVQGDLGRKLERRTSQTLEPNDRAALHFCLERNDSVKRALAVEVVAALALVVVAVRLARGKKPAPGIAG